MQAIAGPTIDWNQHFCFDVVTHPSLRFGGSLLATQHLNIELCNGTGLEVLSRTSISLFTLARNQLQTVQSGSAAIIHCWIQ